MKNHLYKSTLILLFIVIAQCLQAQVNSISGTIIDRKTLEPIELASIRLLKAVDSTYISGTTSNESGIFNLTATPAKYILQISYLGYDDQFINTDITNKSQTIGKISLRENSVLLQEAIITGKAVDMIAKDDTLEYNASSYKVMETAVVEDMLKKMPGVDIDENGILTVNGKEVKKILIDGKEFFTDDPKIALKNLPAKMIDKLQVIDQKSEMAEMTGFFDGDEETVINLTIKPEMKRSLFGDITAGYGSEDKYGARAMGNYMDDKNQISLLFGGNNTNNIGFSDAAADIYAGNKPPGGMDFGGKNGINKTFVSGLNFAHEFAKNRKLSGDISYGNANNDVESQRERSYIGADRLIKTTSLGNNKTENFKANVRFEWSFDPLTKIIFRTSVQHNTNDNDQRSNSETIVEADSLKNTFANTHNTSDGDALRLRGTLNFSRRFTKKGRNLAVSLSGFLNKTDRDGFNYSKTEYMQPSKKPSITDQRYTQKDDSPEWRATLSYVEPLGKDNFLQFKYNIRNKSSETDKKTYVKETPESEMHEIIAPNFTRNVKNDFLNQTVSLNFKRTKKRYNYTLGVGLEPSSSKTTIELPNASEGNKEVPRKNFLSFSPNAEFNYKWDKRHNLRLQYGTKTTQPSTMQLYDGVISQSGSDSLRGNPNLRPRFEGRLDARYQKYNTKKASMITVRGEFIHTQNAIVTVSTWEDAKRSRTYENISGNMAAKLRFIYNTPLWKKKLSFNTNTYTTYERSNTFINTEKSGTAQKNTANIVRLTERIGLRYNSDLFDIDLRGNITYNDTRNSISKENNREVLEFGGYSNISFYLPANIMLSSDIQYSANSGYNSAYNLNEWLWNFTASIEIFKKKNGIIRLNVYDILQERTNITQRSTADFMEYRTSNAIESYFMLNFIYKFNIHKGG